MLTEDSVSVIVPALNEQNGIVPTVRGLMEIFRDMNLRGEIIVIDDGSTDGTREAVSPLQNEYPELRVIHHSRNQGLAASFLEGARCARMGFCFRVHGDNNDPKESLKKILENRGKADLIIPHYTNQNERTPSRQLLSAIYTRAINHITGYRLKYWNGSTLFRTEDLRSVTPRTSSFGFQADLILQVLQRRGSFLEVPTRCDFREAGSHAFRLRNILGVGRFLVRLWIDHRLRYRRDPGADCHTTGKSRTVPPTDPS